MNKLMLILAIMVAQPITTIAQKDMIACGSCTANLIKVESTAYYDSNGYGHGADGRPLVEELTIAGKKEWLGYSAVLYDEDMNYIGIYEFRDTGYGQESGQGSSTLLKNKTVGTIENGTCIDIYFTNHQKCKVWGRRKVYMQLVKAVG